MQNPLRVTFRGMPSSEAIEADIREKADKLEVFFPRITGCHVIVEAPHQHHHQGKIYHIRIDMTVPGSEIVVRRDPGEHHAHEDVYVAIRDAFDAAKRKLEDHVQRLRRNVKAHEATPTARVGKLFPYEGYGFLETEDGREIYFHKNSVLNDAFDRLEEGSKVHFTEEMGEKGPQASTVYLTR